MLWSLDNFGSLSTTQSFSETSSEDESMFSRLCQSNQARYVVTYSRKKERKKKQCHEKQPIHLCGTASQHFDQLDE